MTGQAGTDSLPMFTLQWPFQEPKLEVPTIYKAYVREYPHKIWPYMVQYLHFRILKFPLTLGKPTWLRKITTTLKVNHRTKWAMAYNLYSFLRVLMFDL